MPRKTPVLLRPAPMTGGVNALTNYRRKGDMIMVVGDGKHDVTADFDAIVLETLLDGKGEDSYSGSMPAPDMSLILDIVAQGYGPDTLANDVPTYQAQVKAFRERLVKLIERHNQQGHGSKEGN